MRDQIEIEIWDLIFDRVCDQIRCRTWNLVRFQANGQIRGKIENQIEDQIEDKVEFRIWEQTCDQVFQ